MKENQLILSKIDRITQEIISIITIEKRVAYDEVTYQFKNSITYQLLMDLETELYLSDVIEVLEMWKQEQFMNEFLNTKIPISNNHLLELSNQEIRNSLKKQAFLKEKEIEEVYDAFLYPNEGKANKKIKMTPYNS